MNSPPDAGSLHQLQAGFAAALSAQEADAAECTAFAALLTDDDLPSAARLRVYRNNTRAIFAEAMQRTFPVVRRRVGEEFFATLVREYHAARPSRRGDLHWVGEAFPEWLRTRLPGTGYEWLADLARLEWACEESLVAESDRALPLSEFAGIPPEQIAVVRLQLCPSLRLVSSAYPVWSVWRENQPDSAGSPVDLGLGPQYVVIACSDGGLVLHSLPANHYRFVERLRAGDALGDAVEGAELPVEQLAEALGRAFAEGWVVGLQGPSDR